MLCCYCSENLIGGVPFMYEKHVLYIRKWWLAKEDITVKTFLTQKQEESNMIEKKLAEMMAAMYKREKYFTFADSRKRVECQGKFVEFDSGSFWSYQHNLDYSEWLALGGELRNLVDLNKEERK